MTKTILSIIWLAVLFVAFLVFAPRGLVQITGYVFGSYVVIVLTARSLQHLVEDVLQ